MSFNFSNMDKSDADLMLPVLFKIMYANMQHIAKNEEYNTAYHIWYSKVKPAIAKASRQIVLMYSHDDLAGFFQYYVSDKTLMMEEIQISKEYQGTGIFASFYTWLVTHLPETLEHVEAFSEADNHRSQQILIHLGLKKIGDVQDGEFYQYKGSYKCISDRYL